MKIFSGIAPNAGRGNGQNFKNRKTQWRGGLMRSAKRYSIGVSILTRRGLYERGAARRELIQLLTSERSRGRGRLGKNFF